MSKSIKLKNDTYLDSKGVDYKHTNLETTIDNINSNISTLEASVSNINSYLNELIKVVDIATDKFTFNSGNRYRGSLVITVPSGYKIISIMPCYTSFGDRNFVDYNFYYENNQIYYEIYCQYGYGATGNSNFRVVMIKENI